MKKGLIVLLAMALVMAMTMPAMAAPNLTIKGAYQVWGLSADGINSQNNGSLTTDDNDKRDYVHQRFRVQPQFKASDNVTANLRFDFAEGRWGQDQNFTTARAKDTGFSDIQVDRAYVDVNTQWLRIRAGLQFVPVGQTQVFRDNQPALQFNIKTGSPLDIRVGWIKVNEGIGTGTGLDRLSDETDEFKDQDRYLGVVAYNAEAIKANVFFVGQMDGGKGDSDGDGIQDNFEDEPWVAGFRFRDLKFGSFAFHGEIAQFGGDNGNNVDYVGLQGNVNGMWTLSDKLKLGLDLFYSSAQGDNEIKRTTIGNPFAAYDVKFGGTMGWDTLTYGRNPGQLFSSSPPAGPLPGDIFDPFNTGAGSMGAGLGAMYSPLSWLTTIGQIHYMTADDDDLTGVIGEFESGYNLLLAAVFQIAPTTTLHATYQRVDADFKDNRNPDASSLLGLQMMVKF